MSRTDPIQILLALPKGIEAVLFFVIISLMIRDYKETPFKERPQLHQLLLIGLSGWFVYITLDIIIYIVAPVSFPFSAADGIYTGYPSQYPSLLIANILRDIAFVGACLIAWCYFIAAFNIYHGTLKTSEIFFKKKHYLSLMMGISILIVVMDQVSVKIVDHQTQVKAVWTGVSGFFIFLNITIYIFSSILISKALNVAKHGSPSPEFRRKTTYLARGILFMGFGHTYWLIMGLWASQDPAIFTSIANVFIMQLIGHFLWLMSPVLIYLGLRHQTE